MSIRTWLGLAGADAPGLLREVQLAMQSPCGWTDAVLVLEPQAVADALAHLPPACGQPQPPGWPTQLPEGFHPLQLGPLHLLLCIGAPAHSLHELVCAAHSAWVSVHFTVWGSTAHAHTWSRLARCCGPQATLHLDQPALWPADTASALKNAGFQPVASSPNWVYAPPWPVAEVPDTSGHSALVIGAGLAGVATALALVRRNWRVQLADAHPHPASGASGLPVGVMTEHQAANDTVLSALSRVGVPLHWRELHAHLPQGAGWQPTTVANLKGLPADQLPALNRLLTDTAHRAHLQAGALIRPSALVQAWLQAARATGRLTEHWGHPITSLNKHPCGAGGWCASGAEASAPGLDADQVVVAGAYGSQALLAPWFSSPAALPLRPVKGQLTYGPVAGQAKAPCAIRHQGVWVPAYADAGLPLPAVWAMGSTYERGINDADTTPQSRGANLQSLQALSATAHADVLRQQTDHLLRDWAGVRCASQDRLPLAGPLPSASHRWQASDRLEHLRREPGLWTLSALGSRGLTLSALLGELLAAQMSGAPWPVTRSHTQALDPARFALRHARKAPNLS